MWVSRASIKKRGVATSRCTMAEAHEAQPTGDEAKPSGTDVVSEDDQTGRILIDACRTQDIPLLEDMLLNGANVNVMGPLADTGTYVSLLIIAAVTGNIDLVRILCTFGAEVNLKTNDGLSALMAASMQGKYETVTELIQLGADVNLQSKDGVSALMYACDSGHNETVRVLLGHGAQVDLKTNDGLSALMRASNKGFSETVQVLLDNGAEVNLQENDGWSALFHASQHGHVETVKMLLENGAEKDLQINDGWSALMVASQNGHDETAKVLLEHGSKVDLQNNDGVSALMRASYKGHAETVRVLLEYEAEVDLQTNKGVTALILASMQGYDTIVRMLLLYGAKVGRSSAMFVAMEHSHFNIIEIFSEFPVTESTDPPAQKSVDTIVDKAVDTIVDKSVGFANKAFNFFGRLGKSRSSDTVEPVQELGVPRLKPSFQHLLLLASEWHNIGVLLGINDGTLLKIEHDYRKADDCLREMLRQWLKQTNPPPTWEALATAVEPLDPSKAVEIRKLTQ